MIFISVASKIIFLELETENKGDSDNMNCILSIPNDTIDKFKCLLCNNYLSHFPVFLTNKDINVCGRCTIPEGIVSFRCKIFEEFAQFIKFPCRYKEQGCCEELYPKDVPFHEQECPFKRVECPGKEFTACSWRGARNNILSHCRNSHKDMFLEEGAFELNLNVSNNWQKFLDYKETLFVASINYDYGNKTVSVRIHHVEEATDLENYSCQIDLNRNNLNVTAKTNTTIFPERKFCKIALDSLMKKNKSKTMSIVGSITFGKNVKENELNEVVLSSFKCSECEYYALPPVYQFENKKIKCDECRSGTGSRNLSLDKMGEQLNYPCRYANHGCCFVLKCEEMKKHLPNCLFKNKPCLFCNKWSGLRKEFLNHVKERHSDLIIENGDEILIKNNADTMICTRIIYFANQLFIVKLICVRRTTLPGLYGKSYRYSQDYIACIVNILDHVRNNFLFEVKLKNLKGINNHILMQRICSPLNENAKLLEDYAEETYCKIYNNILQWEETDEIPLKVLIYKQ